MTNLCTVSVPPILTTIMAVAFTIGVARQCKPWTDADPLPATVSLPADEIDLDAYMALRDKD